MLSLLQMIWIVSNSGSQLNKGSIKKRKNVTMNPLKLEKSYDYWSKGAK